MVANEHTEHERSSQIVDRIAAGETIALVSDAGMPGVSDPGQRVVAAVAAAGLQVEIVPGPTAVIGALVASGLVNERFVFEGFLDRKGASRAKQLADIALQPRTTVFYESPKRVDKTLADLIEACGPDRAVAVVRELTKLHETVVRGSLAEVAEVIASTTPKGEFVIVIGGAVPQIVDWTDADLVGEVEQLVELGASKRDAVTQVAMSTGVSRRRIYDLSHS